jgi:hypothetical protein
MNLPPGVYSRKREDRAYAFLDLNHLSTQQLVMNYSWDDLTALLHATDVHIRKHVGTHHTPVGDLNRRLRELLED